VKHEWYFSFEELRPLLEMHLAPLAPLRLLEVGCGDAPLAPAFAGAAADSALATARAVAIDFAASVVEALKRDCAGDGVEYACMDARAMTFADGAFNAVIDKGTIDALISGKGGLKRVRELLGDAIRVLEPGGVLCITSHLNPLKELGETFLEEVLFPVLRGHHRDTWIVYCHASEGDLERQAEADPEGPEPAYLPVVYMIERRARPATRSRRDRTTMEPAPKRRRRMLRRSQRGAEEGGDGDGDEEAAPPKAEVAVRMNFH